MPALSYFGRRDRSGLCEVVAIDEFNLPSRKLPLRRDLIDHALAFNWGYQGSGPAQLALALLADHLGDDKRAVELHQLFKFELIAAIQERSWSLMPEDIDAHIERLTAARSAPASQAPTPASTRRCGVSCGIATSHPARGFPRARWRWRKTEPSSRVSSRSTGCAPSYSR